MSKRGKQTSDGAGIRKGFDEFGNVSCGECIRLKDSNDKLRDQVKRLKASLKNRDKKIEGIIPPGAHTPPSQRSLKRNSSEENRSKRGGGNG